MAKVKDLTNKKFGKLTVIKRAENIGKSTAWYCKCDCGNPNLIKVRGDHLQRGEITSCRCTQKKIFSTIAQQNKKDITNNKFGKLTALYPTDARYHKSIVWHCKCECGKEIDAPASRLSSGHILSCGCLGNSIGEINIENLLKENNINYIKEKVFLDQYFSDTKAHGRYDFYLTDYNRLIEFDGEQHNKEKNLWNNFNNFNYQQLHDKEKNDYAKSHNISLVRLPYTIRDKITLNDILGNKYLIK